MRPRFWLAYAALALAVALLAPSVSPLSGSMDAFATDLANGSFRPFGDFGANQTGAAGEGSTLGGLTGSSKGDFVPGANELPERWVMDRDGRAGSVVIDYVFDPALGAMKRLKAYDVVAADGQTLRASDTRLTPIRLDPTLRYDRLIVGEFDVSFTAGEPVAIFSPHPKAYIERARTVPPLPGGVSFFKDATDTFYALAQTTAVTELHVEYRVSTDYYVFVPPTNVRVRDYDYDASLPRPNVPEALQEDARLVLSRAGVQDPNDVGEVLDKLSEYFRSFEEGDIPPPAEIDEVYLALALGGHGCCRHRAFAFMVTAQAVGIPTRTIVNEAHAFVEVALPNGRWFQINLGGCGTYTINNPDDKPSFFDQAGDPRTEANPDEGRPLPRVETFTNITASPERITKGETYVVEGTVEDPSGRGVGGARVDLYLNETKESQGRLTGAGTTGPDGRFAITASVPAELPARAYQLVARSTDGNLDSIRHDESWSDPPVDVFAPTRIVLPEPQAAVGFPVEIVGRLVDVDGRGVAGATIQWTADGLDQRALTTDGGGRFRANVTFSEQGVKPLVFEHVGSEHHGASIGRMNVSVERGALLVAAEPLDVKRGQPAVLEGKVALTGASLEGRRVDVAVEVPQTRNGQAVLGRIETSGTTDARGDFRIPLTLDARTAPGEYNVGYHVESLGLGATGRIRVLIPVTMIVRAPESVQDGERWVVEAILERDDGTRHDGALVEFTLDNDPKSTRALLTNRTGVARFEVPAGLDEGSHDVRLLAPGDEAHAQADETRRIEIVRPWWAAVPPSVITGVLAALVALLLAAPLLARDGPVGRRLAALAPTLPEARTLRARLLEHPPGAPAVLDPNERVHVLVTARDRDGKERATPILVRLGASKARGRAGRPVEVVAPAKGTEVELLVRARGLARLVTRPKRAIVSIGAYRQAVERGFVEMRERAQLSPSATPRDVVDRVGATVSPSARDRLLEAAALFEQSEYSEREVDRAFYQSFARAMTRVRRETEGFDDPR